MKNYTIATLTAARNSVSEMLNVKFASGLKFYGLGSDDRKNANGELVDVYSMVKPGLFSEKKLARLFVIFNNYGHIEVNVVNDNNKIVDNFYYSSVEQMENNIRQDVIYFARRH